MFNLCLCALPPPGVSLWYYSWCRRPKHSVSNMAKASSQKNNCKNLSLTSKPWSQWYEKHNAQLIKRLILLLALLFWTVSSHQARRETCQRGDTTAVLSIDRSPSFDLTFDHSPSSPPPSAGFFFSAVWRFHSYSSFFHCCLGIETREHNASSCFGCKIVVTLPLCCNSSFFFFAWKLNFNYNFKKHLCTILCVLCQYILFHYSFKYFVTHTKQ